jgi:hypothetical protein
MTNLQLAICDAERNGDIDITTRNTILDIIDAAKFKEKQDEYEAEYIKKGLTSRKIDGERDTTSTLEKSPKGIYAKESVDNIKMAIYEKELMGEISVEEREALLARLGRVTEASTGDIYNMELEVLRHMDEMRDIDVEKPSAMHQIAVIFLELLKISFAVGTVSSGISIASGQRIASAISFAINLSLAALIHTTEISMVKSDAMKIYNGLCTLISKTEDGAKKDRLIAKKEKMGRLLELEG